VPEHSRLPATQGVHRGAVLLGLMHEQEVTSVVTGIANVRILGGLGRVRHNQTFDLAPKLLAI
jgi:hypothetical protein